jgi:hypothetical protein
MSNMLPSQAAPVTRVHSGGAWSVSLAVEPSIIGCRQVAVCRVCHGASIGSQEAKARRLETQTWPRPSEHA